MDITRRDLFKLAGVTALGAAVGQLNVAHAAPKAPKLNAAPVVGSKNVTGTKFSGAAAKVFFTPKIDAPHLIKLYNMVNGEIFGRVGIKLHTGEPHGPNILPRDWVRAFQAQIPNSNII